MQNIKKHKVKAMGMDVVVGVMPPPFGPKFDEVTETRLEYLKKNGFVLDASVPFDENESFKTFLTRQVRIRKEFKKFERVMDHEINNHATSLEGISHSLLSANGMTVQAFDQTIKELQEIKTQLVVMRSFLSVFESNGGLNA